MTEYGMLPTSDRASANKGESSVALDWETLGRSVRRQTLMAVALHFSEVARTPPEGSAGGRVVMDCDFARAKARGSGEASTRGLRRPQGGDATARGPDERFVSES